MQYGDIFGGMKTFDHTLSKNSDLFHKFPFTGFERFGGILIPPGEIPKIVRLEKCLPRPLNTDN